MGANQMQTLKAMREAEAFPGPAVVIGFSPCVLQGIAKVSGTALALHLLSLSLCCPTLVLTVSLGSTCR
jgi:pyruvate/2-oxoacid:ferredoxin oxidoreductase beta subunit